MKFRLYTGLITVLVLISLAGCSRPSSQPGNELAVLCNRMQKNIEQGQSFASELQHFSWKEFSDVGILCPPQGICPVGNLPIVEKASVDNTLLNRVVPLPERLPSTETAATYSAQLASCLSLAKKVCSTNPYGKSEGSENITAQWLELCGQLQSALQGAEYMASRDKTIAADYTFPQLFGYFTASDERVKQKYLEKFTAKTDEYIKLHDELIRNIQEAKQIAVDLSNLKFTPPAASPP